MDDESAEKAISQLSGLYCGAFVHPVTDVVERAVEHSLRKGAKVEVVKDEASASLGNAGVSVPS